MYLFFDTETTGLPKKWNAPISDLNNWPRLVQIAWMCYDEFGNEISSKSEIIRPEGFTIPAESSKIHGITTEIANKKGTSLKKALVEFTSAMNESRVLVAHNMTFDEKVLEAEFLRTKIPNSLFKQKKVCTKEIATEFCKISGNYGYKWPTLSELYIKLFGSDFEGAHNALADVSACARCFFELKKLGIVDV